MSHKVNPAENRVHTEIQKDLNVSSSFLRRNLTLRNICYATTALTMLGMVTFCPQVQVALALSLQMTQTLSTLLTNVLIVGGYMTVMCGKAAVSTVGGLMAERKGIFGRGGEMQVTPEAQKLVSDFMAQSSEVKDLVDGFVAEHVVAEAQSNISAEEFLAEQATVVTPPKIAVEEFLTEEAIPAAQKPISADEFLAEQKAMTPTTPEVKTEKSGPERAAVRSMLRDSAQPVSQKTTQADAMTQEFVMETVWNAIEKEIEAAPLDYSKPIDAAWKDLWNRIEQRTAHVANQPLDGNKFKSTFITKLNRQFMMLQQTMSSKLRSLGMRPKDPSMITPEQKRVMVELNKLRAEIESPLFGSLRPRARM